MNQQQLTTLKNDLLIQCQDTRYGSSTTDRSSWMVCFAKKSIKHRGVEVLTKDEPVLFDPHSIRTLDDSSKYPGRQAFTVYLSKNVGGINTSLFTKDFTFLG